MNREQAMALLKEHTRNEGLIKHALAVEAAMRHLAQKKGEDVEAWGLAGLLHDLDYEEHPDPAEHSLVAAEMLEARGVPGEIVDAVRAHNDRHGLPRETRLAKTLYAVDELCGFITAVALVKGRDLHAVTPKSVKKKLKDKAFARKVNREEIQRGMEELGVERDDFFQEVIDGMCAAAESLGLAGPSGENAAGETGA